MKEIIAKNPANGMTICQRFFEETGDRFIKVEPKSISKIILPNLLKGFENLPVEVIQNEDGWVKISKQDGAEENEKLLKAGEKAEEQVKGESTFDKEVNMLKSAGFIVQTKEYK